jgi:hypothetical protein
MFRWSDVFDKTGELVCERIVWCGNLVWEVEEGIAMSALSAFAQRASDEDCLEEARCGS